MKEIPLSKGKVALVDDADFEWLIQFKWRAYQSDYAGTFYAGRQERANGRSRHVSMHRQILGLTRKDLDVDHRDGNGLNNRRSNLRLANRYQQVWNKRRRKDSFLPYKGIDHGTCGWIARLHFYKKRLEFGFFSTPESAARAYDRIALKYFGEFARLNFPPGSLAITTINS